ncbi:MAG TPA: TMEM175 family protein [Puia sp.]|nr:TMEM175 family protein [Puia sp.]
MNKNRLEAFSDGVIAIIITIMVLEIKTPHDTSWMALREQLPVFFSYLLSFVFIGIYWGNHHHLISALSHVNAAIIWSNMNLLFWLSLIPFATGWMGENRFAQNTVILYAILLLVCGLSFTVLQICVERVTKSNPKLVLALSRVMQKSIFSVICYSISIVLAYYNTLFSAILFCIVAIRWLIPDKNIEKAITK